MPDEFRTVPPHDPRYGRLFPDGDVGNLIVALFEHLTSEYKVACDELGEITGWEAPSIDQIDLDKLGAHLSFPVGEPMFLVRASDRHALTLLRQHRETLSVIRGALGADSAFYPTDEYVAAVDDAVSRFTAWQEADARQGG